ncbi:MAG: lysine--tRNA ligase [Mollicutes bacterium]|nr:lysine--tRNA ligase [Mollicutes bacterium]
MIEEKLTDQEKARIDKLPRYRELGVDPFGSRYDWKDQIRDLRANYGELSAEELKEKAIKVNVAGRLMALRKMGKAAFGNIHDEYGSIQFWIGLQSVGEENYKVFKLSDLGDVAGLEGTLMKSQTGELTIHVEHYTHLSKCLKPLPEKFHGLTDPEERFRHRYVDMIVNEDSRKVAITRSRILSEIRRYCDNLGFLEVETPVLSPIAGGASARPFITHHNALDKDFYLRIATELNLKKAMIGGIDRVYEIGRIFRNEGIDVRHNPEFTTIELYQAYGDLQSMREWTEGLFKDLAEKICGKDKIQWGDIEIDFSKPFRWISMAEAIKEKTGIDFTDDISFEDAVKLAKEHNVPLQKSWNSTGYIMQAFFDEFVEKSLVQPTFIHTYPIEVSPLTKKCADPRFVERFEFFIGGFEFGNSYSELNNPFDQMERFQAQLAARNRGDEEANDIDYTFLDALKYGMPPAGGIGVGIDRTCMLFCNVQNIREVLLFPTMKDEK